MQESSQDQAKDTDATTVRAFPLSEKNADTLIELWKKLVDLHIFHDDLKQQRLRFFLMVQVALLAGFALVIEQAFSADRFSAKLAFVVMAFGATFVGQTLARRTEAMDKRTADYVRTVKNQLRNIELRLKAHVPQLHLMPYEGQYKVLNERSLTLDANGHYEDLAKVANQQKYFSISAEHPASFHERRLIRTISLVWGLGTVMTVCAAVTLILPYLPLLRSFF
jgi:hypothetical protein